MGYKFNPFSGKLDTTDSPDGVFNSVEVNGDITLDDGIAGPVTTLQTITPTQNNTISLPNATGTVALVAGSSGQLLYNNAGANAGVSTMTFDGTSVTLAGRLINSYTSVASSPAKVFTGTWFTGGTSTTNKPHFLIEPTGTTSTAWSTSGTGLGVNAASGFLGNLLDLQVNGTSRAALSTAGRLSIVPSGNGAGIAIGNGSVTLISADRNTQGGIFDIFDNGGTIQCRLDGRGSSGGGSYASYRFGVDTTTPTAPLDINGNTIRLRTARTPASATATGTTGEICWDADYIYICTATNTWKRAALATW